MYSKEVIITAINALEHIYKKKNEGKSNIKEVKELVSLEAYQLGFSDCIEMVKEILYLE